MDLGFCGEKNAFCAEGATQSLTLVPWVHNFYVPKPYRIEFFSLLSCATLLIAVLFLSLSHVQFFFAKLGLK